MRPALLVLALLLAPSPADAARCAYGKVYRPSLGVCQSKAVAQRAGVYRQRYAKASIRHRHKRPAMTRKASLPVVVTYAHHVYNWAYDNRAVIEETTP